MVDGGYFENSGDATALDILKVLKTFKSTDDSRIAPVIIEISNSPGEENPGASLGKSVLEHRFPPMPFPALAPFYAMMNTRDARGTYSQIQVRDAGYPVREFTLAQSDVPLPLSWMLSGAAAQEMRDQIDMYGDPKANPHDTTMVTDIIRSLAQQ